jgi:hypothetical protein
MSSKGTKQMATTKRNRKSVKGLKNLTAKKLAAKQASRVKGGYIGETEKLKSSASSIDWGDGRKR